MAKPQSVGIVGYGAVGRGIGSLFPNAAVYDPALGHATTAEVNASRFAFVCVPTPPAPDGTCDASIVEETITWLESEFIVVRSTVPPGTCARLAASSGKQVIFQPEYGPGETPDHPFADVRSIGWIILGGPREWAVPVADLYKTAYNSQLEIRQTDWATAELAKYMENAFLATKVAFCNEFYGIAEASGIDYNELRELWLMDPRIGRSHTWVHPEDRGFGGKCLPKDLDAIASYARAAGAPAELLETVAAYNRKLRHE